jgi:hypothetical protein
VTKALAEPSVRQRIAATAGEPSTMAFNDIDPFVKAEIAKWAEVVKRAGSSRQPLTRASTSAMRPSGAEADHRGWLPGSRPAHFNSCRWPVHGEFSSASSLWA